MWNSRLDESQAGIKIARRNIKNLRYLNDTTLMTESEENLKSLLMIEENEKAGLTLKKLRSQHLIPSLHGKYLVKKWKQLQIFFSWAPKLSVDSDCSLEVKRCLLLGRKAMRNLSEGESRSVMSNSLWPRRRCTSTAFSSPEYWSQ